MSTLPQAQPVKKNSAFANPLIKKLNRVEETSDTAVTYGGVAGKTFFFMIAVVAGIAAYFILHPMLATGEAIAVDQYSVFVPEALIVFGALLISAFSPFLAFLIRPLVPVLGTLYCLSIGYSFTWLGTTMGNDYGNLIFLALGITIVLVAIMAVLYATGIVKVGKRFRTVVITLFITTALSGLIGFGLSLVPGLKEFMKFFTENPVLSIVVGILYIILACAMLLVDFDSIQQAVEHKVPKKYEWIAAFGLAYTVIYLFLKVFSVLAKAKASGDEN